MWTHLEFISHSLNQTFLLISLFTHYFTFSIFLNASVLLKFFHGDNIVPTRYSLHPSAFSNRYIYLCKSLFSCNYPMQDIRICKPHIHLPTPTKYFESTLLQFNNSPIQHLFTRSQNSSFCIYISIIATRQPILPIFYNYFWLTSTQI